MYDIVIRNGLVYDGEGSPPIVADLALSDGLIAAVSPSIRAGAKKEIDAKGRIVIPGFIDPMSTKS